MSLQLQCPSCGVEFSLREARNDQDWRSFCAVLAQFPQPVQTPLLSYLELFTPAKQSVLRSGTMLKLAQELLPMVKAQAIERKHNSYNVTHGTWASAMSHLSNNRQNLTLPLKGNGYLLGSLANHAEKRAAKAESEVIEKQRHAAGQRQGGSLQQVGNLTAKAVEQTQAPQAPKPRAQPPAEEGVPERSGAHEIYEPLPSISEEQAARNRERLRRLMSGDFDAFTSAGGQP